MGVPVSFLFRPTCDRTHRNKIKKLMYTYGLPSKLKGQPAHEISKITNFCKFQENLYTNLGLLNDYGLRIPTKTNKKTYMYGWIIFKIFLSFTLWNLELTTKSPLNLHK